VSELHLTLDRRCRPSRDARGAFKDWLDTVPCPDQTREDALLVLSELVTNAVVHAHSDPVVAAMFDDGRLRIEVHDRDQSRPHITSSTGSDGGFGLRIVAAATDAWGSQITASGKHVWAEMLC
jgi:anti-sigma regulatory factor (Ser/Thr protein kinase)